MNNWNNQQSNSQQQQSNAQNQSQNQNQPSNQPSGILMKLVGSCLPVLLESFMGQQMPPSSNNGAETSLVLSQLLSMQQQILTTQQALSQRLLTLEQNASQQLTNLTQQVQSIKSIRLSHEKKQIDYHLQSEDETQ